ncbi:hypothetical protein BDW02DRAFT_576937 [Decorospora gaudefroyi]|uniref:Uncharacterized protein n=1 Tax=Decorospora gaudefroyi TaxID=184978 RepID=A0A6A5KVH4_9PLEO|nr:hypothetical protein BDW02DRAFT_576937 [Decorospora gaudefroyi]
MSDLPPSTFLFLNLPVELRNMMYEYYLPKRADIVYLVRRRGLFAHHGSQTLAQTRPLASVSKSIRHEFLSQHLRGSNTCIHIFEVELYMNQVVAFEPNVLRHFSLIVLGGSWSYGLSYELYGLMRYLRMHSWSRCMIVSGLREDPRLYRRNLSQSKRDAVVAIQKLLSSVSPSPKASS